MSSRTCRYMIDVGSGNTGEGRRDRPWIRRFCKRKVKDNSDYCWQHADEKCPCCGETGYDDPLDCSYCEDQGHSHVL